MQHAGRLRERRSKDTALRCMGLVHVSKASSRDAIWDAAGCTVIVSYRAASCGEYFYLSQIFQILSHGIDRLKGTEYKKRTE